MDTNSSLYVRPHLTHALAAAALQSLVHTAVLLHSEEQQLRLPFSTPWAHSQLFPQLRSMQVQSIVAVHSSGTTYRSDWRSLAVVACATW